MPERKKQNKQASRAGGSRRGKQPKLSRSRQGAASARSAALKPRARSSRSALAVEEREKQDTIARFLAMLSSPNAQPVGIPYGFPVSVTARRTQLRNTYTTTPTNGFGIVWRKLLCNDLASGLHTFGMTNTMDFDTFATPSQSVPLLYSSTDFTTTYPTLRVRLCAMHIRIEYVSSFLEIEGTYTTVISPEGGNIGKLDYAQSVARPWTKSIPARKSTDLVWVPKTLDDYDWLGGTETNTTALPFIAAVLVPGTNYAQQILVTTTYYHEYSGGPVDGPRSVPHNSALARATSAIIPDAAQSGQSIGDTCYSYVASHYPEALGVFTGAVGMAGSVLTAGKMARNKLDALRLDHAVGYSNA